MTPSPGPPASIHKATLVQAEAGGCATAKKEQAAGQLTGRKLDLRRLALEASTARAHSSRHLEAAVVDAALPVVEVNIHALLDIGTRSGCVFHLEQCSESHYHAHE